MHTIIPLSAYKRKNFGNQEFQLIIALFAKVRFINMFFPNTNLFSKIVQRVSEYNQINVNTNDFFHGFFRRLYNAGKTVSMSCCSAQKYQLLELFPVEGLHCHALIPLLPLLTLPSVCPPQQGPRAPHTTLPVATLFVPRCSFQCRVLIVTGIENRDGLAACLAVHKYVLTCHRFIDGSQ